MNILPKKRWHVRTKENIARVREDEAKYEEEQRQIGYRAQLAEQEARTELLRRRQHGTDSSSAIAEKSTLSLLSDRSVELIQGNKEYETEKRLEQESQEKSIGLLTYLGQSVVEAGGKKPWYDVHPGKLQSTVNKDKLKEEWENKKKARADPLTAMNKVSEWFERKREEKRIEQLKELQRANSCIAAMPSLFPDDISVPNTSKAINLTGESSSKLVRCASNSDSNTCLDTTETSTSNSQHATTTTTRSVSSAVQLAKQLKLDRLRAERLQRERKERERAAVVMAKAMGLTEALHQPAEAETPVDERRLPFNSAFNPELAASLAERRKRHRDSRKRHYHAD